VPYLRPDQSPTAKSEVSKSALILEASLSR
jgi:hypothetical protein